MTMGHGRRVVASIIGVVLLGSAGVSAQDNTASRAARTWRQGHERAILDEFVALLRLPNIASDRAGIQRNAEAIAEMMRRRGLSPRLLTVEGANPVVFGEIRTPGATRTIGFYAHYDGQPLDPREWTSPPFEPTLRDARGQAILLPAAGAPIDPEWRVYARSAGDDKSPKLTYLGHYDDQFVRENGRWKFLRRQSISDISPLRR